MTHPDPQDREGVDADDHEHDDDQKRKQEQTQKQPGGTSKPAASGANDDSSDASPLGGSTSQSSTATSVGSSGNLDSPTGAKR